MKTLTILLDNGHGRDTKGKRSPLLDGGGRLFEWQYTRSLAQAVIACAMKNKTRAAEVGLRVVELVPETDDVPLSTRAARANVYMKQHPQELCVLFSLHGNAAGNGEQWFNARGFEAWTTIGKTNSDQVAEFLCNRVRQYLPEVRVRTDSTDGDQDKEANFTVIYKANCPAVLSECLFYDNREDVELMQNEQIRLAFGEAHVDAACDYYKSKMQRV